MGGNSIQRTLLRRVRHLRLKGIIPAYPCIPVARGPNRAVPIQLQGNGPSSTGIEAQGGSKSEAPRPATCQGRGKSEALRPATCQGGSKSEALRTATWQGGRRSRRTPRLVPGSVGGAGPPAALPPPAGSCSAGPSAEGPAAEGEEHRTGGFPSAAEGEPCLSAPRTASPSEPRGGTSSWSRAVALGKRQRHEANTPPWVAHASALI